MVSRQHPTAFALKRRIAGVACARLRRHLGLLAASLDVVLRDLMATLRQALRPHAQLASSR